MKQRPRVCDERICVRLPNALVATINKECNKNGSNLSTFVRESLVESLSRVSR
jgi:predicted DNA binding CopG/RHH family protein